MVDFANAVSNLATTVETLGEPVYLENPQFLQELVEKLPDVFKIPWGINAINLGGQGNLKQFANWIDMVSDAASAVTIPKVSIKDTRRDENVFVLESSGGEGKPSEKPVARSCGACGRESQTVSHSGRSPSPNDWNWSRRSDCASDVYDKGIEAETADPRIFVKYRAVSVATTR